MLTLFKRAIHRPKLLGPFGALQIVSTDAVYFLFADNLVIFCFHQEKQDGRLPQVFSAFDPLEEIFFFKK